MKTNNSIINLDEIMYSNAPNRSGQRRVIRPSNFWSVTSFIERLKAAYGVLKGNHCAVKWFDLQQIEILESIDFARRMQNATYTPGQIHKMWNGARPETGRTTCVNCLFDYDKRNFLECPKCGHAHAADHICEFKESDKCIHCSQSCI